MTWTAFLDASDADAAASDNLAHVADYLKVDLGDDDAVLIRCTKAAVQYIIAAVGSFPEGNHEAELLLYAITENLYECRELMQSDIQQRKRIEYTFGSMLLQLQLQYDTWEDEA